MLTCLHCGIQTPRLTLTQRYCPECDRTVTAQIAADEKRRTRVVWRAGETTPWSGRVLV